MGFALAKDGSYIPVANIDIPSVAENVFQFQFVQEEKGRLQLVIVKKPDFGDSDFLKIRNKVAEKFADNMDVSFSFAEEISTTNSQKALIFVQRMKGVDKYGAA